MYVNQTSTQTSPLFDVTLFSSLVLSRRFIMMMMMMVMMIMIMVIAPSQCEAADAEIKVPSGENTELKRSPF